jgi:hypothetical protein
MADHDDRTAEPEVARPLGTCAWKWDDECTNLVASDRLPPGGGRRSDAEQATHASAWPNRSTSSARLNRRPRLCGAKPTASSTPVVPPEIPVA